MKREHGRSQEFPLRCRISYRPLKRLAGVSQECRNSFAHMLNLNEDASRQEARRPRSARLTNVRLCAVVMSPLVQAPPWIQTRSAGFLFSIGGLLHGQVEPGLCQVEVDLGRVELSRSG